MIRHKSKCWPTARWGAQEVWRLHNWRKRGWFCLYWVSASSCCLKQVPEVVDTGLILLQRHPIMSRRKGENGTMVGWWAKCRLWWELRRRSWERHNGLIQSLGEEWRDSEAKEVTNLSKAHSVSSRLWLGSSSASIWSWILPQSLFS